MKDFLACVFKIRKKESSSRVISPSISVVILLCAVHSSIMEILFYISLLLVSVGKNVLLAFSIME
jgi:hypothetical protein